MKTKNKVKEEKKALLIETDRPFVPDPVTLISRLKINERLEINRSGSVFIIRNLGPAKQQKIYWGDLVKKFEIQPIKAREIYSPINMAGIKTFSGFGGKPEELSAEEKINITFFSFLVSDIDGLELFPDLDNPDLCYCNYGTYKVFVQKDNPGHIHYVLDTENNSRIDPPNGMYFYQGDTDYLVLKRKEKEIRNRIPRKKALPYTKDLVI